MSKSTAPSAMHTSSSASHTQSFSLPQQSASTSGEGGLDLKTGKVVTSSLEDQFKAAFKLVDSLLQEAGVEKGIGGAYIIMALVLDMKNEALLMKFFKEIYPDSKPTFMTYAVAVVALEGMEVELQAEALVP
ncbi:unnamed protein product [Clonostachys byssicola]|uniref:Uncharacterized protein n=1 Tax=Clonostachys byssicola TaxID=160290 RepID=A0A9N9Y3L1_9HYPO|nr:unnamed protein product [Clonostachys byssicola]